MEDARKLGNLLKEIESERVDFTKEKRISVCPYCKQEFKYVRGKIYCSKECRENDKHYPSIKEVNEQYEILGNWEQVAQHFGLTRKII